MRTLRFLISSLVLLAFLVPVAAYAQEPGAADTIDPALWAVNNLWIMIAGMLVFIMHLGFASLESGMTQSKNTVNILFKNSMIICIGILTYALCGFNIMYPGDFNGFFSLGAVTDFITVSPENAEALLTPAYDEGYTWYTDFFFQAMFAATAATIVSGGVAGRIKLSSFLLFVVAFLMISYPITGSWQWGGGFLDQMGFYDFAGSTLVHSVGGWGALVFALLLGPRLGKYAADGTSQTIPGSNMSLATIGVFLLWFGWFGFNGGSVLSADPATVSLVLVTTSIAAASGGIAAGLLSWYRDTKPDLTMALDGILAGLGGITAGADLMAVWEASLIGVVAGGLVYASIVVIDEVLKIDDPVGAVSMHLTCGIWGTLAVGLFGEMAGLTQVGYQLAGILAIGAFTVAFCLAVGLALKNTMGLRVDHEEEVEGLDRGEHAMSAYHELVRSHATKG
ncbi:MAG: ammonium transporter [Longimonas sp.]